MTGFKTAHELAMTDLRDQFAMAALTGLITQDHENRGTIQDYVSVAWNIADAMLKARKPGDEP